MFYTLLSRMKCPSLFIFGLVGKVDVHEFKDFHDGRGLRKRCTTVLGLSSGQGAKSVDVIVVGLPAISHLVHLSSNIGPQNAALLLNKGGACYDKINTNSNTNTNTN